MLDHVIREATHADAEAIAGVHVASWRETYRGLIADAVIDSRTIAKRTVQWSGALCAGGHYIFVASVRETVVGFASALVRYPSGPAGRGYVQALYISRVAQGAGLGKALLRATAQALARNGCTSLALHVLPNNHPARDFYEHLGARYVHDCIQIDDDAQWVDAVYEWTDLASLLGSVDEKVHRSHR